MRPARRRRWPQALLVAASAGALCAPLQAQPESPPGSAAAASATARALRAAGFSRVTEDKGVVRATVTGDSLWEIAGAATAGSPVDRNQAMVAIFRANPRAFVGGNIHRIEKGLPLVIPSLAQMRAEDARLAAALVAQHRQAYAARGMAPAALYPLLGLAGAPAAASASKAAPAAPVASSPLPEGPVAAVTLPAPLPMSAERTPAAVAASGAASAAAPVSVAWWPVVVLLALAGVAVAVFRRRRAAPALDDPAASAEHASRLFADSRLELESQLEAQPDAGSEPLYSTLDEPVDAWPEPAAPQAASAASVLVLRNGRADALEVDGASAREVGGDALALALTVAHAYADVGRPEAARRWLRAIDARGAAAFTPAG